MQILRNNYATYATITQELRKNYASLNYARITQRENNYAKMLRVRGQLELGEVIMPGQYSDK